MTMATNAKSSPLLKLLAVVVPLLLAAAAWYTYTIGAPGVVSTDDPRVAALAQALPRIAAEAVEGEADAVRQLGGAIDELTALRQRGQLTGAVSAWEQLLADARSIRNSAGVLAEAAAARTRLADTLPQFRAELRDLIGAAGAAQLVADFEREGRVLVALGNADSAADAPSADAANGALAWFGNTLAGLAGDSSPLDITPLPDGPALNQLGALRERYDTLAGAVTALLAGFDRADDTQATLASLGAAATSLLPPVNSAAGAIPAFSLPSLALPAVLAFAALVSLFVAVAYFRAVKMAGLSAQHAAQNERNQQAILRLLDELGSLADGDLTVEATVTEDITGTIADSINYAIEALRGLVATINDTAIMVDSAAKQTEAAAQSMSKSARLQAHEVKSTTDELGAIAAAIEEVSGNAERSSDVARHSVDVAHKGGEAVRRTIDGMNAIRETIQETSKRIKRLGESSQEIGNIVELINDIAEQTNILALNASIQASMAGEAGRGFAVVADEVQRLAERSTNATKQIEVLVRTIQSDTNEAVVSMERSTTDVVGGALLAENAGAALDEIEQVSNQIASLVQNISTSAREQGSLAGHIDKRTETLRKISDKTGRETAATAAAIRKLSELASQLRGSVAGFQLPDAAAASGAYVTDEELAEQGPAAADVRAAAANARH